MALADRTRLRILNLLRNGEVCVADFTEVLGDSQPKISRHLAYLRNAGIVDTRREGKWIHYCVNWPDDPTVRNVIAAALESLSTREICLADNERYAESLGHNSNEIGSSMDRFENTYVEPYVNNYPESHGEQGYSSHNELDEFLL
jgi:ArsR family transcriptional regulator